jgi:TRAP-type uncharacterized transport system substrate-binding protein
MRVTLSFLLILAAGLVVFFGSRDLIPPKQLTFAAGTKNGGYWHLAERYQNILARDGIQMEILETGGAVENAQLLREGKAQAGFVQGGVPSPEQAESLGAVFFEPILVFARADADIPANPALWTGLKIAAGGEGSGTRAVMVKFARAAQIKPGANRYLAVGQRQAEAALAAEEIDLAFFIAPINAQYLTNLLRSPDFKIIAIDYVEAISARLAQSQVVSVPPGGTSMMPTVPAVEVRALAMVAQLVALDTLHPSLVDRLVEAARIIHSHRDAITADQQFPTMKGVTTRQNSYAHNLLRDGTSSLAGFLPYWVVAQVNRFIILLVPVVVLLLPMLRVVPRLYAWQMRRRIYRYYKDIKGIDANVREEKDPAVLTALDEELTDIDRKLADLSLPLPYSEYSYTARLHIDLVRKRIGDRLALAEEAAA